MPSASLLSVLLFCFVLSVVAQQQCSHNIQCKPGSVLRPNPSHVPSSNGCGNPMVSVVGSFDMTPCCDKHDICYDTCGTEKETCDIQFKQCLDAFCDSFGNSDNTCQSQAAMYSMGVGIFGCGSFRDAQRNACKCTPRNEL